MTQVNTVVVVHYFSLFTNKIDGCHITNGTILCTIFNLVKAFFIIFAKTIYPVKYGPDRQMHLHFYTYIQWIKCVSGHHVCCVIRFTATTGAFILVL